MESTSGGCVFCGGKPLTKEHVWPEWVRRQFPDRGPATYAKQTRRKGEAAPEPTRWRGRDFDLQVKCVCGPCNNGWMSKLETDAKGFLRPMVVGNGYELHKMGQSYVATWALKTAMMFQCRDRDDPISAEHHRFLFENRLPPDDVQVWVGTFSGWVSTCTHT